MRQLVRLAKKMSRLNASDVDAFNEIGPCSNAKHSIGEHLFDGMGSVNSWLQFVGKSETRFLPKEVSNSAIMCDLLSILTQQSFVDKALAVFLNCNDVCAERNV